MTKKAPLMSIAKRIPKVIKADGVRPGPEYQDINVAREIHYEKIMSYRNGFPYPVTLIDRNGLPIRIDPLPQGKLTTDFVVDIRYRLNPGIGLDFNAFMENLSQSNEAEYNTIRSVMGSETTYYKLTTTELCIQYTLSAAIMETRGRSVYLDQLDLVVHYSELDPKPVHPASVAGRKILNASDEVEGEFIYHVLINDPQGLFGDKFINIGGVVYRVKALCDPNKADGVYLRTVRPAGYETFSDHAVEMHYDFDSVKKYIPLYNNVEDARTLGDLETQKKRELAELKHQHTLELSQKEHDRANERIEYEQRLNELKQQIQLKDEENKLRAQWWKETSFTQEQHADQRKWSYDEWKAFHDREAMEDKYYYERRSNQRKDMAEILKWLPTLIVGVGVILTKFRIVPNG